MGLDDILGAAKNLLGSEQGEQISDTVLDKVEEFVDEKTGGKFSAQLDAAKQAADGAIGTN